MAAPTAAFTVIPLADVDPDSPVTTDLFDAIRLNQQNVFAQLVGDPVSGPTFTPAAEHDHDGVNSAFVSAAGGGALRLLETITVGSNLTSLDFTVTLDGDNDGSYFLIGFWRSTSSAVDLDLRANTSGTGGTIASFSAAPGTIFFHTMIKAFSDGADAQLNTRWGISLIGRDQGASVAALTSAFTFSPGLGTNITSLGIETDVASQIRIGSKFYLYRVVD